VIRSTTYLVTAFLLFVFSISCKKENNIGLAGQQYPTYKINTNTSLQVKALTVRVDSILTANVSNSMFGTYYDPVFGKVGCSFATQFFAHASTIVRRSDVVLDSIVLVLQPDSDLNGYGNINSASGKQHIKIYELTNDIISGHAYYNNQQMANVFYNSSVAPVAELDIIPTSSDPIKIRLSNNIGDIGDRILKGISTGLIRDGEPKTMYSIFKGLYVTAENPLQQVGEGAITNLNLMTGKFNKTRIQISYSALGKTAFTQQDSLIHSTLELVPLSSTNSFNVITHDYSNTPFINKLNGTEPEPDNIYIAGGAGLKSKIILPFLQSFSNKDSGNIVINKCELTFQLDQNTLDDRFPPPKKLVLLKIDSLGVGVKTPDEASGINFDGNYNSNSKSYTFNITRYAQQVITGSTKKDYGLFLQATGAGSSVNRVVLKGKQNILVNLLYTKLK
jgi:hypothetical protein